MSIGIYKITNTLNNKCYIGQSTNIEKRFSQHTSIYEWERTNSNLYKAFFKYGFQNFTFEIIEECSIEELDDKEKYWITYYDSCNNGYNILPGGQCNREDNHPKHKLTKQDVIDIRTRYNNHERKIEVYKDYKERIGESGFSKIWKGETWVSIMPEIYTEENRRFHMQDTSMKGENNGRSILTTEDVYNIRLRKKNGEDKKIVYEDYKDKITFKSFENTWYGCNWKEIVV